MSNLEDQPPPLAPPEHLLTVKDLSTALKKLLKDFCAMALFEACLPVTEMKTMTLGQIESTVFANYIQIVNNADIGDYCTKWLMADVPTDDHMEAIRSIAARLINTRNVSTHHSNFIYLYINSLSNSILFSDLE